MDEAAAEEGRSRTWRAAGVHAQCARTRAAPSRNRSPALISLLRRLVRASTDARTRIAGVRVGIVDVGANTVRLLVAARERDRLVAVREDRVQLGLGDEIERTGRISKEKADEAAATAAAHVRRARKLRCAAIEVLVTSPGRQAQNGCELVARLSESTGALSRVLSAEEEGELAWHGAVAAAGELPDPVAVCDVGGGSAQIGVGTLSSGPAWVRSVDIGSLRLTRRAFHDDPPSSSDLDEAARAIDAAFGELSPPFTLAALAVGGTARALRRIAGDELDADALAGAVERLRRIDSRQIAKDFRIDRDRARTVTAGALILSEIQKRLGVPLEVGRGGIREGAALMLLDTTAAATG
jgi:exopolyphosphatase / guanosine-5'-triphosphate,3'-diphosphate pyrophosphatase